MLLQIKQENIEFVHRNLSTLKIANNPVSLVSVSLVCVVLIDQTQRRGLWGNTNTEFIRLLLTGEAFPGALLSLSASLSFALSLCLSFCLAHLLLRPFSKFYLEKNPRQRYIKVNNVRAKYVCVLLWALEREYWITFYI